MIKFNILCRIFLQNVYEMSKINKAINESTRLTGPQEEEEFTSWACTPVVSPVAGEIE